VAIGESLVLASAKAQVAIPAGEIRGSVYADLDNSNSPTNLDIGIGNVVITLTGTDNQGNLIEVSTNTVNTFGAISTLNLLRINGAVAQNVTCIATLRLSRGEYLFCRLPSANINGYRISETQPLDYLDRNESLGTLASGNAAGLVGNDFFSAIAVRNNLDTGAGERGRAYHFGEFPIFANISGRVYREASVPANFVDDEDEEDPGIITQVSLQCNPAYSGTASQSTDASGIYLFERVLVAAQCTITETQPAGYNNAYNTRGTGAISDTGSSGSGNSSITLNRWQRRKQLCRNPIRRYHQCHHMFTGKPDPERIS
jgi:hypothetical protein